MMIPEEELREVEVLLPARLSPLSALPRGVSWNRLSRLQQMLCIRMLGHKEHLEQIRAASAKKKASWREYILALFEPGPLRDVLLRRMARNSRANPELPAEYALRVLLHLTLNTGHCRRSPRSEVSDPAIRALAPLIESGRGPLPINTSYICTIARTEGMASFDLSGFSGPVIVGVVSAREERAREAWNLALEFYAKHFRGFPRATMPPRAPWLAVALLPGLRAERANEREDERWMADFERCLAWALIEGGL